MLWSQVAVRVGIAFVALCDVDPRMPVGILLSGRRLVYTALRANVHISSLHVTDSHALALVHRLFLDRSVRRHAHQATPYDPPSLSSAP